MPDVILERFELREPKSAYMSTDEHDARVNTVATGRFATMDDAVAALLRSLPEQMTWGAWAYFWIVDKATDWWWRVDYQGEDDPRYEWYAYPFHNPMSEAGFYCDSKGRRTCYGHERLDDCHEKG